MYVITGHRFDVPRFLQNALDRTPINLDLQWVYQSLLETWVTMQGFYRRNALEIRWDKRMEEQFIMAWETNFYELFIDSHESDDNDLPERQWQEFQTFANSFTGRGAERHGYERLWRSFDRLLIPLNIISPYCLEDPEPTDEWFYVADSEEY
ncbi:hypothetical protein CF95_gp032 [Erwinia phage PhiEaH1]|uniref:Uncharacterized protein n=1 Tax=Erwinia phage PhiEaH1 TaxID=1401669 RepID=W8D042_9CAUD|nr:hypothetical protein CF95_gp032 [Erwinia phage PhiEaH1]AGX01754.1 hypothetical protein [Erwinia phage PhiEaH1]